MGKVWLDATEIGTFDPQTEGTSGDIYLNSSDIGSFTALEATGYVYLNSTEIGDYYSLPYQPPPPFSDARARIKYYLDKYIVPTMITKDDDETVASFAVIYEYPPYPLEMEFNAETDAVDLLFLVGCPTSEPLIIHSRYLERVPITIWCIDKPGITGTKLKWKAERELRRIARLYPWGSFCALDRISDNDERLGSTTFYSTKMMFNYRRTAL